MHDRPETARDTLGGETIAARQRAKYALLEQVERLRRRAHSLEALAYATDGNYIHYSLLDS